MSKSPTEDRLRDLSLIAPSACRLEAEMQATREAVQMRQEQWRRIEADIRERFSGRVGLPNTDTRISPSPPLPDTPGVVSLADLNEKIIERLDEIKSAILRIGDAEPAGTRPVQDEARDALPATWTGRWITHREAARIIGYTSAQSGVTASGDTLRKAIMAAPEGDPLALLRDKTHRCAKHARTGRLRHDAVIRVALERGTHTGDAVRAATPGERRKARNERALNAEWPGMPS